jgi:hypothetical protein
LQSLPTKLEKQQKAQMMELLLAMREDKKTEREEMLANMDANQKEAEAMLNDI